MKNKKSNNGFIFVETITVIVILTTALIMIYVSFSRLLANEKRRAMFDDTTYIYRTYYLEDFLVSLNLDQYINTHLVSDQHLVEFTCNDISLYNVTDENAKISDVELNKKAFCEKIINESDVLNVSHIYIIPYYVGDLKKCTTTTGLINKDGSCSEADRLILKSMSTNMIHYIRTLTGGKGSDGYRLLVEYQETTTDSTDYYVLKSGTCKNNYKLNDGKCYRTITHSYYNNVELVTRGVTS